MRFDFIHAESATSPVSVLCRMLGVSRSGYYSWTKRGVCERTVEDELLAVEVRAIHAKSRGAYGSPQIHRELRKTRAVSRKRIARLMRREGLRGAVPPRFRKTTLSDHDRRVATNVLGRDFCAARPNQKWVGDITYIWTAEGSMYLAVIIDLFSRRVVGWAAANHMRASLAADALRMALGRHRPPPGLVHHTDRGSQYASAEYQALLASHGIICSMSRSGDCWDNAVAESFFATLKKELIRRYRWLGRVDAARAVAEYIEVFYNNHRLHSSLGYFTPADYETINSTPQVPELAA